MNSPLNSREIDGLRTLLDREAIRDVLAKYFYFIDRLDWEMVRSCFHEDAVFHEDEDFIEQADDGSFTSGTIDDFVVWARDYLPRKFSQAMHFGGQSLIDIDGDVAECKTYAVVYQRCHPGQDGTTIDLILGGRLLDTVERRDGAWRIAQRQLVIDWVRTDPVG
jgi:hypothetical protein